MGYRNTRMPPIFAVVAGITAAFAFAPWSVWPLILVATGTVWVLILHTPSSRQAFFIGFGYGIGLCSIGLAWLVTAMGDSIGLPLLLAIACAAAVMAIAALPYAAAAAIIRRFVRKTVITDLLLLLPVIWLCAELVRALWWLRFPWLLTAHSLTASPFNAFAPIVGEWGVGLSGLLFVAALLALLRRTGMRWALIQLILMVIATISATTMLGRWTSPAKKESTVAIVQGNIGVSEQWYLWTPAQTVAHYNSLLSDLDADIVAWPETALAVRETHIRPLLSSIERQATQQNQAWIVGLITQEGDDDDAPYYSSLRVFGATTPPANEYRKHELVPFGEYTPLSLVLTPVAQWLAIPMAHFSAGERLQAPLVAANARISASLCYEGAFSTQIRRQSVDSDFLFNASNEMWFGNSHELPQLWQILQLRAAENGRYLLRAANTGISGLIDNTGRTVITMPTHQADATVVTVPHKYGMTPFQHIGHIPILAAMLLIAGLRVVTRDNKHM